MRSMLTSVESFGISDIGFVRENNEDVWKISPETSLFILADGMGGHNAGEIAASTAVESMCTSMGALRDETTVEEACQLLRAAVSLANAKVFNQSQINPTLYGMGTTLTCFILLKNFLIYAHIGDSRLYRYRNTLTQLTDDHSLCNSLSERNQQPQIKSHVITRAIGNLPTILPDIGVISMNEKDLYMLCSDGLSDYMTDNKISQILNSPLSLEEMGKTLVKSALEKGGNDNITLLLVKI